ncbi:hypothetical protein BH18THE2_BH18THE2_18140 [soil metagenome]
MKYISYFPHSSSFYEMDNTDVDAFSNFLPDIRINAAANALSIIKAKPKIRSTVNVIAQTS